MTDKEYIFKLMSRAFLDIRVASYAKDSYTCFVLSDVFHNVPAQMNLADEGKYDYAEILAGIKQKCEARNCLSWLDTVTADITRQR